MPNRATLTPKEQHFQYAKVVETIKYYRDAANYIAAYIISFSALEDRLNAMYRERKSASGVPTTHEKAVGCFYTKKVDYLLNSTAQVFWPSVS